MLSLKQLVTKVHEVKKHMPQTAEILSLKDVSRINGRQPEQEDGGVEGEDRGRIAQNGRQPMTLETIERQRMERDRAGIIFSNILR